ncbi:MAG: bifunctional nuclease family protein [Firmicutes bacterium]|nr:bifunctional nuclease family protein [Bacillota bacterium]
MLEMKVKAVTVGQSGEFSVLLTDKREKKVLPIVIGPLEAHSIALPLQGELPTRPLTHDLLKTLVYQLGGIIEKIVITDIRDNTYFAEIHLRHDGRVTIIDSRPSDAIALALRFAAPIYMAPWLVEFTYDIADIAFDSQEETH